jgi:hypothetical protein
VPSAKLADPQPLSSSASRAKPQIQRQIIKMGKLDNQVAIVTGIAFRLRCCVSGFGQFKGAAGGAERGMRSWALIR